MMRYFGVDIGNSGIRVSELLVDEPRLGETLRLYWRFQTSNPAPPRHELLPDLRFDPGQEDWTEQLGPLLQQPGARWLVSSVRRDAREQLERAIQTADQHECRLLQYRDLKLHVEVDFPDKV
ncbi:MAG: hypothetical protein AAGG44_16205, partial [Planctomycetota bacterium]